MPIAPGFDGSVRHIYGSAPSGSTFRGSSPELEDVFLWSRAGFHDFVNFAVKEDEDLKAMRPEIVDMAIVGVDSPSTFTSFGEIKDRYIALTEKITDDTDELTAGQIRADLMMARVLGGEEVDFGEFAFATTGRVLQRVSTEEIEAYRDRLDEVTRADRGFDYSSDPDRYRKEYAIRTAKEVERDIKRNLKHSMRIVGDYLWVPKDGVEFEYDNDASEPWFGGVQTDENEEFVGAFNTSPKRLWTRGKTRVVALHELGVHYVQAKHWERQIVEGNLTRSAGLTSITSPETAYFETVAAIGETLISEFGSSEEDAMIAAVQQNTDDYRHAVMHEAHIDINEGHSEAKVIGRAAKLLQGIMEPEVIATYIQSGRDEPTERTNGLLYLPTRPLARQFIDIKDPSERQAILTKLYDGYYTPEDVQKILSGIN